MHYQTPIAKGFAAIGAAVELGEIAQPRWGRDDRALTVDVTEHRRGERFRLLTNPDREVRFVVSHVSPVQRHLLLLTFDDGPRLAPLAKPVVSRYLCGHDERHWFAAAVPESQRVSTVAEALHALRPPLVRSSLWHHGVGVRGRDRRRNAAFIRQGEWFFIPRPDFVPAAGAILRDEPLQRGRSRPHRAQELYRCGGKVVYVPAGPLPRTAESLPRIEDGITQEAWEQLVRRAPELLRARWRAMRRDAEVYARGRITHPDHHTAVLPFWHLVVPNTESKARATRNLVFLD